jgi:hypothetical protein
LLTLRSSNPQMLAEWLARKYVLRGALLLRAIAPNPGWWRNCINRGHSRIRTAYGGEGPAALAFEYDTRFTDEYGYVQDYKVLDHFFGRLRTTRVTARLGLCAGTVAGYTLFPKTHPGVVITSNILDDSWGKFLMDPPISWYINYRQPDAVENWLRRKALISAPRRPSLFARIFGRPSNAV